jgi:starvation-inducible DNA-binding protein
MEARLESVNSDAEDESCRNVVRLLRIVLADEHLLYTKTRNYRWNVVGPLFRELHRLFQEQCESIDRSIEEIAERIRALGAWSPGSLADFLHEGRLDEQGGDPPSWLDMIGNLLADHESLAGSLYINAERCLDDYRDAATSKFLLDLMRKHQRMAWMLRALDEGPE